MRIYYEFIHIGNQIKSFSFFRLIARFDVNQCFEKNNENTGKPSQIDPLTPDNAIKRFGDGFEIG